MCEKSSAEGLNTTLCNAESDSKELDFFVLTRYLVCSLKIVEPQIIVCFVALNSRCLLLTLSAVHLNIIFATS